LSEKKGWLHTNYIQIIMIRTISVDGPTRVDLNTHDVRQKANTFQFDSSDQTLCENWLSSGA